MNSQLAWGSAAIPPGYVNLPGTDTTVIHEYRNPGIPVIDAGDPFPRDNSRQGDALPVLKIKQIPICDPDQSYNPISNKCVDKPVCGKPTTQEEIERCETQCYIQFGADSLKCVALGAVVNPAVGVGCEILTGIDTSICQNKCDDPVTVNCTTNPTEPNPPKDPVKVLESAPSLDPLSSPVSSLITDPSAPVVPIISPVTPVPQPQPVSQLEVPEPTPTPTPQPGPDTDPFKDPIASTGSESRPLNVCPAGTTGTPPFCERTGDPVVDPVLCSEDRLNPFCIDPIGPGVCPPGTTGTPPRCERTVVVCTQDPLNPACVEPDPVLCTEDPLNPACIDPTGPGVCPQGTTGTPPFCERTGDPVVDPVCLSVDGCPEPPVVDPICFSVDGCPEPPVDPLTDQVDCTQVPLDPACVDPLAPTPDQPGAPTCDEEGNPPGCIPITDPNAAASEVVTEPGAGEEVVTEPGAGEEVVTDPNAAATGEVTDPGLVEEVVPEPEPDVTTEAIPEPPPEE